MCLVDNYELGAGAHEIDSAAVAFDVVDTDNGVRILLEQGAGHVESAFAFDLPFQCGHGAWPDDHCIQVKLIPQLRLPLFAQVGWTQHRDSLDFAAVE